MSIISASTPEKIVNGLLSNVNASKSQLPYEFNREDYQFAQILNDSGLVALQINGDQTGSIFISDRLYVHFNSDYTSGIYLVEGVFYDSISFTEVKLSIPFTESFVQGYFNNNTTRANYKLRIQILEGISSPDTPLIPFHFNYTPEQNGRIFIDVSQILNDYLSFIKSNSIQYKLSFQETWRGFTIGLIHLTPIIQAITAKKQIGLPGGSNLWEYLLRIGIDPEKKLEDWKGLTDYNKSYQNVENAGGDPNQARFSLLGTHTADFKDLDYFLSIDIDGVSYAGSHRCDTNSFFTDPDTKVKTFTTFNGTGRGLISIRNWEFISNAWRMRSEIPELFTSKELRLEQPLPERTQDYVFTIEYSVTVENNTSGTVALASLRDGASIGSDNLPLSTTRVFYTITKPGNLSSINNFGFQLRPQVGDGTIMTFIIYSIDISTNTNGKILTKFESPFLWRNWKRTVSVLRDSNYNSRVEASNFRILQENANINKIRGSRILSGFGSQETKIQSFELLAGDSFYNELRVTNTTTTENLAEPVYYQILESCKNPVMVEFVNSLGVKEQHLFSINQEVNLEASPGLSYITPHSTDQEQIEGDKNRVFSEDRQTFLLIAENLTNNQIKALAEIKISGDVFVYLSRDGTEKIKVITRDLLGSNYETRNQANNEFRLLVEFPDNYDFFEAKLY